MDLQIEADGALQGMVRLPGDKSVTHRALILGALAEGETRIVGASPAADCARTLACLRALGVPVERPAPGHLLVHGQGHYGLREPAGILDAGNSATTMRLLCGVLAGQPFYAVLDGSDSLRRRPMARITRPLRQMGATVLGREEGRFPPLTVQGGPLWAISWSLEVASAQVKSALLLAGLYARGETVLHEPAPSRDHTERLLRQMGVVLHTHDGELAIAGGQRLHPTEVVVPGDISAAAFFLVAAAVIPGSHLYLPGVGVNPTRSGILEVLRAMGAEVHLFSQKERGGEPLADLEVRAVPLQGVEVGGAMIPRLIDELPVLAVAATQAEGVTVVRDAAELRRKESDRIGAIVAGLRRMGARIEERPDGLVVQGPTLLRGAVCSSCGDHRIAMALTVAGLVARGRTTVQDVACIADSFPAFIPQLRRVAPAGAVLVFSQEGG